MTQTLPIVFLANEPWFIDTRLQQARKVSNPHDHLTLDEFTVCLRLDVRLHR